MKGLGRPVLSSLFRLRAIDQIHLCKGMGYLLVPMFSESFNIQNQLKEDTETAILIITSKQIRLKYQILYGAGV